MKLGVCTKLHNLDIIKNLGFEYIEFRLADTAKMTDEELLEAIKLLDKSNMRAETFNLFCSSELNLSYAADEHEISAYAKCALSKAQKLGGEIIVLGSGKARKIPEEYCFEEGKSKFKRVVSLVSDIAADYNIKVALEPLNTNETNLINTLADAAEICEEIDKPNLGFLADLFHMYKNGESVSEIEKYRDMIIHAHIARRDDMRGAPSIAAGAEDLVEFHGTLAKIGYNGRISLEASSKNDFETSVNDFAKLADHLKIR
jgi:sugar phosphate isomerase/epimerase